MNTLVVSPASLSEASFLERLRAGETDAIATAYDLHHRALCSFATRLLGDEQAAEDLVHDVFVLLPSLAHRLDLGRSLRGFLLGIAANRARHYVRSRLRRGRATARLANEPPPGVDSPERIAEQRALARALSRALAELPIAQRVTFVLSEVEGFGPSETAEILGIPEATARTRLFHARQRLRAELAKERA